MEHRGYLHLSFHVKKEEKEKKNKSMELTVKMCAT